MTTTTIVPNKRTSNTPVYLSSGQTSGNLDISIPFVAEYIMILNDTPATIAVMIGEQSTQGPEAQIWTPGTYLSLPLLQATQKLTVFWSSPSAIATDNNLVQFYFSNVTIPLQGGRYGESASSQDVNVLNTVTVEFGSTPGVNVLSTPVAMGSDGTNNHPLKTDSNGQLNVNVETIPALQLQAGQTVGLSSTGNLIQALTAGVVSSNQITVSSTAVALINGSITGSRIRIRNSDPTNSIFIGAANVTATTGYELGPKEFIDFEIITGSTINIYGIAVTGTPIASILIME